MTTDNVRPILVWKKGATAEERLQELAFMARSNPERFAKMVVIYQEESDIGCFETRYICNGVTDSCSLLGLIELGKDSILRYITR